MAIAIPREKRRRRGYRKRIKLMILAVIGVVLLLAGMGAVRAIPATQATATQSDWPFAGQTTSWSPARVQLL